MRGLEPLTPCLQKRLTFSIRPEEVPHRGGIDHVRAAEIDEQPGDRVRSAMHSVLDGYGGFSEGIIQIGPKRPGPVRVPRQSLRKKSKARREVSSYERTRTNQRVYRQPT
jgi:hypothetical protein